MKVTKRLGPSPVTWRGKARDGFEWTRFEIRRVNWWKRELVAVQTSKVIRPDLEALWLPVETRLMWFAACWTPAVRWLILPLLAWGHFLGRDDHHVYSVERWKI